MGQTMAKADPDNGVVEEQRAGWDKKVKRKEVQWVKKLVSTIDMSYKT